MVVRADLPPGMQLAQACHAAVALVLRDGPTLGRWEATSNNLVVLQVDTESALLDVAARAVDVEHLVFREPDLDGQATAVALHPTPAARRLVSNLPLAGKVMAGVT